MDINMDSGEDSFTKKEAKNSNEQEIETYLKLIEEWT